MAEAFSPIMMLAAFVLTQTTIGLTEACRLRWWPP
jgi:hypothetical protein